MKAPQIATILGALTLGTANAAIGVQESTGEFTINGSTSFLSPIQGTTSNPDLNGYDFGSLNPGNGDTLILTNWYLENYAYDSGGTGQQDNNWINNGDSATLLLSINGNSNNQALTYLSQSGNNHFWSNAPDSVNLLSGLSNGDYTLNVSVSYTYNQWDGSSAFVHTSTGNGLAAATFSVVPEPTAAMLGLFGTVLLLRRRR